MITQNSIHANFSVDDLDEAKKFYVDKLGFRLSKKYEDSIVLESESGAKVNIYYKEDHAAWDSTVLGIEVDDVEKAIEELEDMNVYVELLPGTDDKGIAHDPEMGDATWFRDPAGNWVCVSNGL